jgi:hypothetical protein
MQLPTATANRPLLYSSALTLFYSNEKNVSYEKGDIFYTVANRNPRQFSTYSTACKQRRLLDHC